MNMLALGIILLVLAITTLALSLRGRTTARGVFCRRCRFDLHGLDLTTPSPTCPECGSDLSSPENTRPKLRKRRPFLLALGVLLFVAGAGLLAARHANKAWYAKMPERLLLLLESSGDKEALDELHTRMNADILSDRAFKSLVLRSLAMVDRTVIPWDPRWGDALLLALVQDRLAEDQVKALFERAFIPRIEARDRINESDETARYRIILDTNPRTAPTPQHPALNLSKYNATIKIGRGWTEDTPRPFLRRIHSGANYFHGWTPSPTSYGKNIQSVRIPTDTAARFTVHINVVFTLHDGEHEIHSWTTQLDHQAVRSSTPVEYSAPLTDESLAQRYASSLSLSYIFVPINRDPGRKHHGTDKFHHARSFPMWVREPTLPMETAVLFDVYFRSDDQEIYFTSLDTLEPHRLKMNRGMFLDGNMLDYFDRHAVFWDQVVERNEVDVILRTNPDLAGNDPRYRRHLDAAIIFRDVPLMVFVPTQTEGVEKQTGRQIWDWVRQDHRNYSMVPGELLPADANPPSPAASAKFPAAEP